MAGLGAARLVPAWLDMVWQGKVKLHLLYGLVEFVYAILTRVEVGLIWVALHRKKIKPKGPGKLPKRRRTSKKRRKSVRR